MIAIKLSDDQAAQLGITKENDAGATLVAKLGEIDSLKASFGKLTETFSTFQSAQTTASSANSAALNSISAKVDGFKILTEDRVKELASLSAATALGSAGFQPVSPAGQSEPDPAPAAQADALIAAGKYEEAWQASDALKAEFSSAKIFAAYTKANASGQVRIHQPKTS